MSDRQRHLWLCWAGVLGLLPSCVARAADPPVAVMAAEQQRVDAIAKAVQSTVAVFAAGGQGGGSGVVITPDGYALSNYHVVAPTGPCMRCGMVDGNLYDAVVVGVDPTGDVSLIKLLGRDDFPVAEMGDSDHVRVGDWCFAAGNPFLLATDFQPTVTYGIVSGVRRYQPPAGTLLEYTDCIQTDAAINPGNSGGPLFDASGRLIGINGRGSFEKRGRVSVGVGYAISINQINKFLGYLHSGRIVDHATLGATVTTDDQGRVVVSNILESSDAFRRGLRFGDQLLSFGGRPVTSVNGFKSVLGIYPKGWRVPVTFRREDRIVETHVRLAGVHTQEDLLKNVQKPPTEQPGLPPAPKEKPSPSKEKDEPSPNERPGLPLPLPNAMTPQPPPPHVAPLIKKRPGYANYYFNELNRNRVWNAFTAHGNFREAAGTWVIAGRASGAGPFEITLGTEQVVGKFPTSQDRVDVRNDLDQQLAPPASGGLLPALHLWQRMLTLGPEQFGETYYLGTAPLINHDGLYDVLVAVHNVVETRFSFDPRTGLLVAVEMFPATDADPCEISFSNYRELDGRWLPHTAVVRHGEDVFATLEIDKYSLSP